MSDGELEYTVENKGDIQDKDLEADVLLQKKSRENAIEIIKNIARFAISAIWGVFGRKGIMAITEYNNISLALLIWGNFSALLVAFMILATAKLIIKYDATTSKGVIPIFCGLALGFLFACLPEITKMLEEANEANNPFFKRIYTSNVPGYGIMEFLGSTVSFVALVHITIELGRYLTKSIDGINRSIYLKIFSIFAAITIIALVNMLCSITYSQWHLAASMSPLQTFTDSIAVSLLNKFFPNN